MPKITKKMAMEMKLKQNQQAQHKMSPKTGLQILQQLARNDGSALTREAFQTIKEYIMELEIDQLERGGK